jgi:hypothetical protein
MKYLSILKWVRSLSKYCLVKTTQKKNTYVFSPCVPPCPFCCVPHTQLCAKNRLQCSIWHISSQSIGFIPWRLYMRFVGHWNRILSDCFRFPLANHYFTIDASWSAAALCDISRSTLSQVRCLNWELRVSHFACHRVRKVNLKTSRASFRQTIGYFWLACRL